ncbi:MAG TPA: hypothetical protein VE687_12160, partial [Stellaceae bacterium]|nr:hypothetical protein [Stellaceae bacterium]
MIWPGIVLIIAILLTVENALRIGFLSELNYNEGWNVYNAQRLINNELIYDGNFWRVNNYPIGSFLLVAGVNLMAGDLLLAGRVVALVAFAALGLLATIATRRFGGSRADAVFGAGCALGFCYIVAPAWIMVDDPQTLAEAVTLGGLVCYISRPPDRASLLCSASLIVLGGFIKHNGEAIAIAITLDLAIRSPRRLPFWLASCGGFGAVFLVLTRAIAGGGFIGHLLSPRIFTWHGVHYHLMKYLRAFKFPLLTVIIGCRLVFPGDRFILAAWGGASILLASIFAGFEGASYNMFQDAAVFLGIAAGVMFSELRRTIAAAAGRRTFTKLLAGLAPCLLVQPILTRAPNALVQLYHSPALLAANRRSEEAFLADAKFISDARGPAICESLLLCYTAGQPFILDPFNSRQYILSGRLDETELIRRIAAREFAVVQLRADICDDPTTSSCHILHS